MSDKKILVSMIAYRERYLEEAVRSCYMSASKPENLIFSIVSEQEKDSLHANLDFIPKSQIIYNKYDLSEYRGVLWSRAKTVDAAIDLQYDYVLYTCGHNRFAPNWDIGSIEMYDRVKNLAQKPLITIAGPSFVPSIDGSVKAHDQRNIYRPRINEDYIPGHGFPEQTDVPDFIDLVEDVYLQFSWVFAPRSFVDEVPLNSDMNYHGEEIYTTVQAWCSGWRFFTTSKIFYYHDTEKQYEDERLPRMTTHRPWSDLNKNAFWEQSDRSMLDLNNLLSGNLTTKHKKVTLDAVLDYCNFSGLDPKWALHNPNYHKLSAERHAQFFRDKEPFSLDPDEI